MTTVTLDAPTIGAINDLLMGELDFNIGDRETINGQVYTWGERGADYTLTTTTDEGVLEITLVSDGFSGHDVDPNARLIAA